MIRPDIDTDLIAEILTDIFAASFRTWASSSFDIALAGHRIGFGAAMVFAGCAPEPIATRMREKAALHQAAAIAFERAVASAATARDAAASA
jgi:hypothetical protein